MYEAKACILRCVKAAKKAGFSCNGQIPTFYNQEKKITFSVDTGKKTMVWSFKPKSKIVSKKSAQILEWIDKEMFN